jgi:Protein of unknown function (DUF2752)
MTVVRHGRIATVARAAAPPILIALVAVILLRFPPAQSRFYPQCPIYAALHLQCPGCGATRALAALLHGHVREAFYLNALVILILPFATIYAIAWYRRFVRREALRLPHAPPAAIYASVAIATIFGILRNLPLH